ncbi:MAG: hypothetical protein AMXMBFR84_13830 [Candidatus Hydrogenedentota bacterium]
MTNQQAIPTPGGLYLLAVLCLILGLMGVLGLVMMSAMTPMPEQATLPQSPTGENAVSLETDPPLPKPTAYDFVSGGVTSALYIVTGIGLLLRNRWLGFYLGNMTGILVIANALVFSFVQGPGGLVMQIPRMIPPMALLLLLNLRFAGLFRDSDQEAVIAVE